MAPAPVIQFSLRALSRRVLGGVVLALILAVGIDQRAAQAGPLQEIAGLTGFWRDNAPLCDQAPSSEDCEDGDMTLFSALLCTAGEKLGCESVAAAQDESGRWHRSPRLRLNPELRPTDSFSWDMALGVQLYAATTGDKASLERWLGWVESVRPCLVESPVIEGKTYCLVRGWPRWCTDDTEKGCTARPQDLATLVVSVDALKATIPPPAESKLPGGVAGAFLAPLLVASREANAAFSLEKLLALTRGLQPTILLLDAAGNEPGFPRHLVAVNVMLMRNLGQGSATVDQAAQVLAGLQPQNPFFQLLRGAPREQVAQDVLAIAPRENATLPQKKADWTWQRDTSEETWKRSNLWDFVFIANLLRQSGP